MELKNIVQPLPLDPAPLVVLAESQKFYQVLWLACNLEIFSGLEQSKTADQLAQEKNFEPTTTQYLLELLWQGGYLNKEGKLYKNSSLSAFYLREKNFLNFLHFFPANFPLDSFGEQLRYCLQGEGPQPSPEPQWNVDRLRQIGVNSLLGSLQSTVKACNLTGVDSLLDLGGGHGFYSLAFAQQYSDLKVTLFDLPQVLPLAGQLIQKFALEKQITLMPGNFLQEEIGEDYGAVLCANILHRDKRQIVLNKVWHALKKDGKIIVKCRVEDCENNLSTALAKLEWHLKGGKELFPQEVWHGYLAERGFSQIETIAVQGFFATIIGKK